MSDFGAAIIIPGHVQAVVLRSVLQKASSSRFEFAIFHRAEPRLTMLLSLDTRLRDDDSDRQGALIEALAVANACEVIGVVCFWTVMLKAYAHDETGRWAWSEMGTSTEGNFALPFEVVGQKLGLAPGELGLQLRGKPALEPDPRWWQPLSS